MSPLFCCRPLPEGSILAARLAAVYNADGKNYPADSRFPFPGFKEYSLVLRLGTQVEQGGTDVRFTTTSSASLEICLNDDDIARTRRGGGGYEVHIQVDQLGP